MAIPSELFGFLVVDKPKGVTSHDIVAKVRRGIAIKRIGHAGTLDPMATGVLVLCIGAATRLSEYVMGSHKVYTAIIRLGVETDSYDADGMVVATTDVSHLTPAAIESALQHFQGEIDQTPPMYSAIKQGGKKLYELARQGEAVERAARRVWMRLRLLELSLPDVQIEVTCSAGTYIRSIAHDLGERLDVGGHLTVLRRVRSGALDNPVAWSVLTEAMANGTWQRHLIDETVALSTMPALSLDDQQAQDILHGRTIPANDMTLDGLRRAYGYGRFIAVVQRDGDRWQPVKVFHSEREA
ncbi:MAG: tRNA pseudouridine(55) synthase TruB [Anaerolineae bacterium]|nr:tRNA pseudouridine(55) synthase TruB [Anaerolineae bacterium]